MNTQPITFLLFNSLFSFFFFTLFILFYKLSLPFCLYKAIKGAEQTKRYLMFTRVRMRMGMKANHSMKTHQKKKKWKPGKENKLVFALVYTNMCQINNAEPKNIKLWEERLWGFVLMWCACVHVCMESFGSRACKWWLGCCIFTMRT